MWPFEQMLSPIRDNMISPNPNANEIVLMEKIKKQKLDLLQKRISPDQVNLVRPEIVASWIRSNDFGLDPFNYNQYIIMDDLEFTALLREKDFFIKAAEPYLYQLESMDNSYLIFLTDETGVILRVLCGNHQVLEQVKEKFQLTPGAIWTEATVGTCSHVMSLYLRRPIQLCGPELYLETCSYIMGLLLANSDPMSNADPDVIILNQTACSSAPIFDAVGNLAGSVTIISPYLHHQNVHSLGLTASTAWAIQNQYQLALNSELLSVTLEAADEAVLTVNRAGVITKANMMAQKLFYHLDREITGMPMEQVFGNQAQIRSVLESGQPIFNARLQTNAGEEFYLRSAQAVKDHLGTIFGCVLTFKGTSPLKKQTTVVNHLQSGPSFSSIAENSPHLGSLLKMAENFARLDANILIQGESGTGKEVFARAIHNESRPNQPFVAVNCAAIPKSLIESELFGYEGGAFTGAERQGRSGKIELANGGTLFLDEIGDMPLDLQPVLLRVLEEKSVMRVGGRRSLPVDFRLIAVSNKNLIDLVNQKRFREDLYYRLAVFTMNLPPLRERGTDVIQLAKYFIDGFAREQHKMPPVLSDAAMFCLLQYAWPGNIRQLKNAMLSAVAMTNNGLIDISDLPEEMRSAVLEKTRPASSAEVLLGQRKSSSEQTLKEMEKMAIMKALLMSKNSVGEAAASLGMSRSTLYRKIKSYGLMNAGKQ